MNNFNGNKNDYNFDNRLEMNLYVFLIMII